MKYSTRTFVLTFLAIMLASEGRGRQGHSGVMVPVFAYGPGAMAFTGVRDNTELFHDFVRLLFPDKKQR